MTSPSIAIIGAGPAGLIAADRLSEKGARVTLYERMPSVARKLLMAGRGGLNLTNNEPAEAFLPRYREAEARLAPAIADFGPQALRDWCTGLGIETFVGSSGRIFPSALKASPLVRALLARLSARGVTIRTRWRFTGFDDGLRFETPDGALILPAPDATLLALGGASWPRLGSDGSWHEILAEAGVALTPLRPANSGFTVDWSEFFSNRFAGTPLKRIVASHGGHAVAGEAMVTRSGIEGGAIYALSADLREALAAGDATSVTLDLRPDIEPGELEQRLSTPRGKRSLSTHLRKSAGLAPVAISLLSEFGERPQQPAALAAKIKALDIPLSGIAGMSRAISTAGGVSWEGLDEALMLASLPGVFVAGEMIDWEAPTGGYLLQASFATGLRAAEGIARRLGL
jgi:uncharacterized flavoprotein (TIGR03862 family)